MPPRPRAPEPPPPSRRDLVFLNRIVYAVEVVGFVAAMVYSVVTDSPNVFAGAMVVALIVIATMGGPGWKGWRRR